MKNVPADGAMEPAAGSDRLIVVGGLQGIIFFLHFFAKAVNCTQARNKSHTNHPRGVHSYKASNSSRRRPVLQLVQLQLFAGLAVSNSGTIIPSLIWK